MIVMHAALQSSVTAALLAVNCFKGQICDGCHHPAVHPFVYPMVIC